MKNHQKLLNCFVILALCTSGLFLGACKKAKQHRQDVATGAAINTVMMTNPLGSMFSNTSPSSSGTPSKAPAEVTGTGCPAINFGLNVTFNPLPNLGGSIDLAYNNDCIVHGMEMSGEVKSTWEFDISSYVPLNLTLNSTVDFDNLTMEGMHTDGTLTQNISIVNSLPTALINGTLTTTHADGKTRSMEFDDLTAAISLHNNAKFEKIFHDISISITDNDTIAMVVNGNGKYTDEDGMVSAMTFSNVKQPIGCVMPYSGQLHLVNTQKNYDAQIDYGDGTTCDTLITIAVNGGDPQEIDVAQWLAEHSGK